MTWTHGIVLAVIVGLLVYDAFAQKLGQPTESMVLRDWARQWTILPLIAGILVGHWFGPRRAVNFSAWGFAIPILALTLGLDLAFLVFPKDPIPIWRWPLWWALIGIPTGLYLWGQGAPWSPVG